MSCYIKRGQKMIGVTCSAHGAVSCQQLCRERFCLSVFVGVIHTFVYVCLYFVYVQHSWSLTEMCSHCVIRWRSGHSDSLTVVFEVEESVSV